MAFEGFEGLICPACSNSLDESILEENMDKIEKMINYESLSIERFLECMNKIDFDNDQNFKRLIQVLRIMSEKMNNTNTMFVSYRGIQNIKNDNTIRKKILASRFIDGFD